MTKLANINSLHTSTAVIPGKAEKFISGFSGGLSEQIKQVRKISTANGRALTKFAEMVIFLLEVTMQLSELDAASEQANQAAEYENEETRKWREISATTMEFARTALSAEQARALEVLEDLLSRGASLVQEPELQHRAIEKCWIPEAQETQSRIAALAFAAGPPGNSHLGDCSSPRSRADVEPPPSVLETPLPPPLPPLSAARPESARERAKAALAGLRSLPGPKEQASSYRQAPSSSAACLALRQQVRCAEKDRSSARALMDLARASVGDTVEVWQPQVCC